MKYEKPLLDIINLDVCDIIKTSSFQIKDEGDNQKTQDGSWL